MTFLLSPSFTEEHGLFYLWRSEPHKNLTQLAGEFKTEAQMQKHSADIFGMEAIRREAA